MKLAIQFALVSLFFAGLLDVSFKAFSRQYTTRGIFVFGCGFVWFSLQLGLFYILGLTPLLNIIVFVYGISGGLILAVANILLIESLKHLEVSLGATIYRLNTIGVVIFSFLFLGETLGTLKLNGILCGVIAIWMLHYDKPKGTSPNLINMFVWVAISASFLRAIFGIIAKVGLQAGADLYTTLLLYSVSWMIVGLVYAVLKEKDIEITWKKSGYSILTGSLLCVVANSLIWALNLGEVSIVVPIANMSFITALLVAGILGIEQLSWKKGIAITTAAFAVFLLAQTT